MRLRSFSAVSERRSLSGTAAFAAMRAAFRRDGSVLLPENEPVQSDDDRPKDRHGEPGKNGKGAFAYGGRLEDRAGGRGRKARGAREARIEREERLPHVPPLSRGLLPGCFCHTLAR